MRRHRLAPVASAFALVVATEVAGAQTVACPPAVELGPGVPPRVEQRVRRVLDLVASLPRAAECAPSHARIEWDDHELSIRVALDDGRIAVRSLESLEDVLPTLLAVLAVPAADPPGTPTPAAPPPPPPPVVIVAADPVAVPVAPTPPPVLLAPPVAAPRWSLLVGLGAGAVAQDGAPPFGRWGAEVGAASPRFALTARGAMTFSLDDERGRSQHRRRETSAVVSARARLGSGRWRVEVGGFGGVAHVGAARESSWLPRFGLEAALRWELTSAIGAFVRAEGYMDLGGDQGPGVALTLGATWEPQR